MHLFTTNQDVDNHNRRCLAALNCPIARNVVVALSRKSYRYEVEEKMEMELLILVGSTVMLTSNLWTYAGWVNGAFGFVDFFCIIVDVHLKSLLHMF